MVIGAVEMLAYLAADALTYRGTDGAESPDVSVFPDGLVIRFAALPPTVRVAEGTSVALIDETVRVVQAINAALFQGWQLGFDPEPLPAGMTDLIDGDTLVTFARQADWLVEAASPTEEDTGLTEPQYRITLTGDPEIPWGIEVVAGRVWVDPTLTEGQERLGVIAHELIHLLGRNHVDPARFPETIMVAGGSEELPPTFSIRWTARLCSRCTGGSGRSSRRPTSQKSWAPGRTRRCMSEVPSASRAPKSHGGRR